MTNKANCIIINRADKEEIWGVSQRSSRVRQGGSERNLMMSISSRLAAGLGGQGQGDGVAVGLSEDDLGLVDGVGSVLELGNVEALLLLDVVADNLGDDDVLGHAVLDGLGDGDVDVNDKGFGDEGNLVALGLVLLTAVLVFASSVVGTVSGGTAGCHLHGLGLGLISHLNQLKIDKRVRYKACALSARSS